MAVELAVSPSVLVPGLYLTVNLLAGTSGPATGDLKVCLMATQSSAGDLTDDTEVRRGGGESSASTAFGPGTVGHLAAELLYTIYPTAIVDFVSPAAGSGTATLAVTIAGVPTSNNVIDIDIMGRTWEVSWLVGETAAAIATRVIDSITQRTNELACTAVTGGSGVCTINGKVAGNVGNDILVYMKLRSGTTGTETINTGVTLDSQLAGATTDPDFTNAIAAIAGTEYHFIVPCLSNADAKNVSTANNLSLLKTHIENNNTGLDAKLQTFLVGFTELWTEAVASTPHANSCGNAEFGEFITCEYGRSLPGELAGRECGGWLLGLGTDPAVNRIGEKLTGVYGSRDKIADKPTSTELQSAIGNGVTPVSYDATDAEMLVRPVTTHSLDDASGPDRRLLDCQNVHATYIVARDIRSRLPAEFPNAKITPDIEPGGDPPPRGVIEEKDIKAFIISILRFWQTEGVIQKASLDTAIDTGTLIVQVNSSDPTQVDINIPFKIIQPLAKMGVVAQRQPG